jgi:hypothetical protein
VVQAAKHTFGEGIGIGIVVFRREQSGQRSVEIVGHGVSILF